MIKIQNKKDCCGCSACKNICPKKCISMVEDQEGFSYPKIDIKSCINCKMCEHACPIINKKSKDFANKVIESYAIFNKNESTRKNSSSGGLFPLFAEKILDLNGIIIGAAFDDNFVVRHVAIENKTELYKLQSSKYVQSNPQNIFQITKTYLDDGRTVLYSGTACQIAGLKSFLRKDYENLYTIDVLCHGVPSPMILQKYLDYRREKANDDKISSVSFRDKSTGWKSYNTKIEFEHSTYLDKQVNDPYMKLFLGEAILRPSCHDCKFKDMNRDSDITLGDAWGINKIFPKMDDDKGTSVMFIHSEKGRKLAESILEDTTYIKSDLDTLLPPTADSRKSVKPHKNRDKVFALLIESNDFDKALKLIKPSLSSRIIYKLKSVAKKILKRQ